MTTLLQLKPGTRFQLADPLLPLVGTLEMANECRARVRMDRATVDVEFTGSDGETRAFKATRGHVTSWTPNIEVIPLDGDNPAPRAAQAAVWGHRADAVVRWCGQQGWSINEIKMAFSELKVSLDGIDVRKEWLAGMRDAPCARLTAKQAQKMEDLL